MLTRTFLHIPGVGPVTEARLWRGGVEGWEKALGLPGPPGGFSAERWEMARQALAGSVRSLDAGDHRYFAGALPPRHHWRAFPQFRSRVGYLDIETDGLGPWSQVTVVGLYDGLRTRTYVAGDNLEQFPEDLRRYALLVTFNGATFDLPYLRRRFGNIFDQLHVDLRYLLGGLGYRGGLKSIERELGIRRPAEIADVDGEDAVRLWQEYRRGSAEALALLTEYNRADVENLEGLMALAYQRAWEKRLADEASFVRMAQTSDSPRS